MSFIGRSKQFPRTFAGLNDLDRLPWFERRGEELVVVDPNIARAVDMHTHLSLAFVNPKTVDLNAAHDRVEHYLPRDVPLDLDIYVNRNFRPSDLKAMKLDLTLGAITARSGRTHTVPNLVREMRNLSITHSVLLSIEMPQPLSDNTNHWQRAVSNGGAQDQLVLFGSVHPLSWRMRAQLDEQVALGVRGIKVHPSVQMVRPDHPRALKLYRLCGERGLPVLWHCGPVDIEPALGRYMSQLRHYQRAVDESPGVTFVLGHSGALQMDQAIEIAKRHPNVWMELSSQSVSNIEKLLDVLGEDRLLFGSDWPFYHQAIPLAKVLMATEGSPHARSKLLYENAARLLSLTGAEAKASPSS